MLLVSMEAGWLTIWSALLGAWLGRPVGEALLPVPAIPALIGGGWLLTRTAQRRRWSIGRTRTAIAVGGILAALVAVRAGPLAGYAPTDAEWLGALARALPATFRRPDPAVLALPFALYLWWRGIRRGRQPLYAGDVEGAFRWGVLAMVAGLVLRLASTAGTPADTAAAALAMFLFAGLTSIALAQIESMQRESHARENTALAVNRHWLGFLVALVALVLLAAVALAQLFSFDFLDALARPVLAAIRTVVLLLLFAIALPVGFLMEAVVWLIRRLLGNAPPAELPKIDLGAFDQLRDQTERAALSPEVVAVIKWAVLGLIALGILAALVRSITRLSDWGTDDEVDEERDFVWTWPGLRAVLLRWLARWMLRRSPAVQAPVSAVPAADGPPQTLSIRAMYRELLRLGAVLGRPRHPSQTPDEYADHLRDHPALPADDLDTVTGAYVHARYGPEPPDEAAAADARRALERLRAGVGGAGSDTA
ncbi:MAG: DUF4129 domain-containing protein [Chloroflexi bacterium]|nr:DUF4129 domain-containing protein [Chloroflexota bacterium]